MGDGEVFKRQGLERKVMMFLVCDLKRDCETWVSLSLCACFWGKLLVFLQNPTMTPLAKVQSQKPPDPGWEPPGQWAGGWNLMVPTNLFHENVFCSLHYEAFLLQRQNNSILFACMAYACGGTCVQECGCMHLHACMWKLRKTLSIFSLLPSCCLDTGSPTNLKFTILARLVAQKISRIHLSLLLDAEVTGMHSNVCVFV